MYAVDYDGYASCSCCRRCDAKLIAQIVEQPYIVIAYEPYDFGAGVGHGGELSRKRHIAARHHRAVFEPVVEYVAQQIQPWARGAMACRKAVTFFRALYGRACSLLLRMSLRK